MRRLAIASLAALLACSSGATTAGSPLPSPPVTTPQPAPAPDLVFAVKGDWGAGTKAQRDVTKRMCAERERTPYRYVVTTGDNFYRPDGTATSANYFGPEHCLYSHPDHEWRASWGNHDAGFRSTERVLGSRKTYSWSAGGVHFFALDSNAANSESQREWLATRLAASKARVKVVYFHHPPFTVGGVHEPDARVRRNWVPLFERYDVTLVLNGHEHDYEHHVVNDVDYVVTGGGGAVLYGCVHRAESLRKCTAVHHFLIVTVRGAAVEVRAIRPDGRVLDRFTIQA